LNHFAAPWTLILFTKYATVICIRMCSIYIRTWSIYSRVRKSMAYRLRRVRRARRGRSLSGFIRARMVGLLFLVFAIVVTGAITYLTAVLPESYIVISSSGISVASTVPQGGTGLSSKLIISLLGYAAGIVLFISALRRLGVTL
ncbi:hypothetical protein, partial [Chloroflexus sp.]|uniref:hypothetical protein n=1 Tax=Chloroflexus sp. TaxID=1904827 RepID=UPI002ACDC729